jgi:hypothetical protein
MDDKIGRATGAILDWIDSKEAPFQAGLTISVFISAIILLATLPTPAQAIIVNPSELGAGWAGTEYGDGYSFPVLGGVSYASYDYSYNYNNGSYILFDSYITLFDSKVSCQSYFDQVIEQGNSTIYPIGDQGAYWQQSGNHNLNYSEYAFVRGAVYCDIGVIALSENYTKGNALILNIIELQVEKIDREFGQ